MLLFLRARFGGPIRILTACLLCWSASVSAAEYINFGGFSRHFDRDLGLNEFNPGIGYGEDYTKYPDMDLSWTVGVFKNSLRRASFYGTVDYAVWHPVEGIRVGATAGLASGYHHSPIIPLVMPFAEWRISRVGIQAYVVPTIKDYVDGAFMFQVKWRID